MILGAATAGADDDVSGDADDVSGDEAAAGGASLLGTYCK